MNSDCAICYVSDTGFLLPSLVSAASVRKFVPADKAGIFIFTVGVDGARLEGARALLTQYGIQIAPIDEFIFGSIDEARLKLTQTPLATFGRFFMDSLLPATCQRIVYLDGDVLCVSDPSELVDTPVPEGRFAAAEDTILYRQRIGFGYTARSIREYFDQLGLRPENGYFNAGVFAASRQTWRNIAREALGFFLDNPSLCKHFDQSALNAVMGDRRLRLSAKWNFQTQLKIWGADRFVTPRICHFNRYPKPWMGRCEPWSDLYPYYQTATAPFTALHLPLTALGKEQIDALNMATRKSYSYLDLPFVARAALAAMNFRGFERSAWI